MSSHISLATKRGRRSRYSQASVLTRSGSTATGSSRPSRLTSTRSLVFSPSGTGFITVGDPLKQWIILKISLGVLTMVIGAVLALGINVIMLDKMIYAVPSDHILYPDDIEDLEITGLFREHCQFQHRKSKRCLTITGAKLGGPLLLRPCEYSISRAQLQIFQYDPKDKLLKVKHVPELGNPDQQNNIEVCVISKGRDVLTTPCDKAGPKKKWFYTNDIRFYQRDNNRDMCITATIKQPRLKLARCIKKKFITQQFKCVVVQKSRLFEPYPHIHKINIDVEYNEDMEEVNYNNHETNNSIIIDIMTTLAAKQDTFEVPPFIEIDKNEEPKESKNKKTKESGSKKILDKKEEKEELRKVEGNKDRNKDEQSTEENIEPTKDEDTTDKTSKNIDDFRHAKIPGYDKNKKQLMSPKKSVSSSSDKKENLSYFTIPFYNYSKITPFYDQIVLFDDE